MVQSGFTLIENLIIAVVIGIFAVMTLPSFLAFLNRIKLDHAIAEVQGALQEAQREAIRRSQPCTVTLDFAAREITGPCLITGTRTLPEEVTMATNLTSSGTSNQVQITFGILGGSVFDVETEITPPPTDPVGKIVFHLAETDENKPCLAISNTLGLTRSGTYLGDLNPAAITDSGTCTASPSAS
jgi:type II secretory pathway pseudopilin PulG